MSDSSTVISSEYPSSSNMSNESVGSRESSSCRKTLRLRLPKFTRGYVHKDFLKTFAPIVSRNNILDIGRLKYPNEWMMTLSTAESRCKLLKKGVVTVRNKKCVIFPYDDNEVCGKVHWLPTEIGDGPILDILRRFGEVSIFEREKIMDNSDQIGTSIRFFVMTLKPNVTQETIPHFITVSRSEGLVTVKGRQPMCFGCKGDHKKVNCSSRKNKFPSKAKKPKSKEHGSAAQQAKDSKASASAGINPRNAGTQAVAASLGACNSLPKSTSGSLPAIDPNNVQDLLSLFSQKLVDALNTVSENAGAAASSNISAEVKKSKKKKKKNKKKNGYDVTATSNSATIESSTCDVKIEPCVTEDQPIAAACESSNESITNPAASSVCVDKKKKKKKKKAKASNSTNI